MKIAREQEERLVLLIQGAVCALFLGSAVLQEIRAQKKTRKRILASNARRAEKLADEEYRWKRKLMRQRYKRKLKKDLPTRLSYGKIK